jgi:hypothetical protein
VWHQLLCLGARVAGLLFASLGGAILAQALITAFVLVLFLIRVPFNSMLACMLSQ